MEITSFGLHPGKQKDVVKLKEADRFNPDTWKLPRDQYTITPNIFWEALYRSNIDIQTKLIAYIVRNTWGWKVGRGPGNDRKRWIIIRPAKLAEKLHTSKRNVYYGLEKLIKKKILKHNARRYQINERYTKWKGVMKDWQGIQEKA